MKILLLSFLFLSSGAWCTDNPYLLFREIDQGVINLDMNVGDNIVKLERTRADINLLFNRFNQFNNKFTATLITQVENDEVLRGLQLTVLHRAVKTYLSLSSKVQTLASQTGIHSKKDLRKYLDSDDEQKNRLGLTWLNLQLDNINYFMNSYRGYFKVKKLRILMNAEDKSYQVKANQLKDFTSLLISRGTEKNLKRSFKKIKGYRGDLQASAHQLLKRKTSVEVREKLLKKTRKDLRKGYRKDRWFKTGRFLLHHASGLFGNSMGAIKFRRGFLDKNDNLNQEIISELKPLDMITEKTPFILTDKFIPGNFGHNAIWLGTKEQLIDMGMWEHPSIKKLQPMIEIGYSIIETDRSGTHLKNIDKFMNVDDFAIMRLDGVTDSRNYLEEVYKVAIAQLGKTYDFNFDVETTDKLVCSELLYQSFGDIAWPTEAYLGRTTISPDNVASLIMYSLGPLNLEYYIKGQEDRSVLYKTEEDLARDLGFRKNPELSTLDLPYYDQPYKKCVKVVRDGKKRRVCYTAYKHFKYERPNFLIGLQ
ncbi:MAG: hypothetical protein KC493_06025 [Bacteriovoracaceae bacterium]|nr:hypothetical protein [Bacteriovoracaceae bacterium]